MRRTALILATLIALLAAAAAGHYLAGPDADIALEAVPDLSASDDALAAPCNSCDARHQRLRKKKEAQDD